jgi:hypothetical protein
MTPADTQRGGQLWPLLGAFLLLTGTLVWAGVFVVPFLGMSLAQGSLLAAGLFVAGEFLFWLGAAVAGPIAVRRLLGRLPRRRHLSPE